MPQSTQRLCGKYKTHRPEHKAQEQAGPQLTSHNSGLSHTCAPSQASPLAWTSDLCLQLKI